MCSEDLLPLLFRNLRHIAPTNIGVAVTASIASPFNSLLGVISETVNRRRIERSTIHPPLFVLGHWRSGTTLLHELLSLDKRFTYPTTYQCLVPRHFVFSSSWLAPVIQCVAPKHRPMDSMPAHVSLPQEDEFALCILGAVSPYIAWGFPEQYAQWPKMLDTEELSPEDRQVWQNAIQWFAKRVSTLQSKRIIFKSPPHTARMKALHEVFPAAQFVHIIRDPYDVFLSTVRTWRSMTETHWIEKTKFDRLEEQVFDAFIQMYRAFERDRPAIPEGQIHEVRFDELVAQPLEVIEGIYQQLDLGGFEGVRPKLENYFADRKDYRKHNYDRDPELEKRIAERWGEVSERFGYSSSK